MDGSLSTKEALWTTKSCHLTGTRVAFRRLISGLNHQIVTISTDGTSGEEVVHTSQVALEPLDWSSDGRWIVFKDGSGLAARRVDDGQHVDVTDIGLNANFSPDGRWLVYESGREGSSEIYVVSFPEIAGLQQVSSGGGREPRWSAGSNEIFFWRGDSLMVSQASTVESFSYETPRPLWVHSQANESLQNMYDVTANGQRFLMPEENPGAPATEIQVVLNWFEELKRRVPN